ncbi:MULTISPECIES: ParB N-terminal domain-containing protein [unclassified Aeromicrobium]|uniref:ParB N-terminal domain-containing protein n=1 Tax=unclassified Aeromicrobium TaxID=2633570 RepID=UPI00396B1C69
MSEIAGHIELERRTDSIRVGVRHRQTTGDLSALVASIGRVGLLQPITITPDGLLICGYRRLEAVKQLGWRTLRVWVRPGLSDDLARLLAERDENTTHKPLTALEAAALYDEVKTLLSEDAARRQQLSRFGREDDVCAGQPGAAESAAPERGHGDVRRQAAELVTHRASYNQLEQILQMERVAADRSRPADVRKVAENELQQVRNGGAVDPSYQRVRAVVTAAEKRPTPADDFDEMAAAALARKKEEDRRRARQNKARRAASLASIRRSPRSFTLLWAEMLGWSGRYDAEQLAREIKDDDWQLFRNVLDESTAFAREVEALRPGVAT